MRSRGISRSSPRRKNVLVCSLTVGSHVEAERRDIRDIKPSEWIVKQQFARGRMARARITGRNFRRTAHRGLVIRDRALIKAKLRSLQRACATLHTHTHTFYVRMCAYIPAGTGREGIELAGNDAYTWSTSCSHVSLSRELLAN